MIEKPWSIAIPIQQRVDRSSFYLSTYNFVAMVHSDLKSMSKILAHPSSQQHERPDDRRIAGSLCRSLQDGALPAFTCFHVLRMLVRPVNWGIVWAVCGELGRFPVSHRLVVWMGSGKGTSSSYRVEGKMPDMGSVGKDKVSMACYRRCVKL